MAIAFDVGSTGGYNSGLTTSLSWSHTCSGEDRALVVGVAASTASDYVTGVTYNGVALTLVAKLAPSGRRWSYLYLLLAPPSGTYTVVVTASATSDLLGGATSYTGVKQTDNPHVFTTNVGATSATSTSVTTTLDGCWGVLLENGYEGGNAPLAGGSGTVRRAYDTGLGNWGLFDEQQATAGSLTLTTARTSVGGNHILLALCPTVVGGTITRSATGVVHGYANSTSLSFSYTCTGSNRFLAVALKLYGTDDVTSVTYNGVSLVHISDGELLLDSGSTRLKVYGLTGPASGANTIQVTRSGANHIVASAVAYEGVAQSGQPAAFAVDGIFGAATEPPVTIATAGSWIVGAGAGQADGGSFMDGEQGLFLGENTLVLGGILGLFDSESGLNPGTRLITIRKTPGTAIIDGVVFVLAPFAVVGDLTRAVAETVTVADSRSVSVFPLDTTTVSRTWFNTLVDDSGDLTSGTIVDVAFVDAIYDDIDALFVGDLDIGGVLTAPGGLGTTPLGPVAKTDQSNVFEGDQTIDGDLFVTGEVNPVRLAEQKVKIDRLEGRAVGDPAGSRTVMSRSLIAGLSLRHDEDLAQGRLSVGNYDTQTYQPLLVEVETLQVRTGVSPGDRLERLRVHSSGGVTVGDDHTIDPGAHVLQAEGGLGTTPLDAAQILSGTVDDQRLSVNVLKHAGGYPGGATSFLHNDGTFTRPDGFVPAAHKTSHEPGGTDALTALDASTLTTGTVDDTRLSANVLTHPAGYPGGSTANFLRADGTFATPVGPVPHFDIAESLPVPPFPALDNARLYALDVNGFTMVEVADGGQNVVRLASDNVLVAKVAQANPGIARGAAVYISGAQGANALVKLAQSNDMNTMPCIGVALDGGTNNLFIRVLLSGTLEQLPTASFAEGDALFVSPDVPGAFTTVIPQAPAFAQRVGFVTRAHATAGAILVLTTGVIGAPRHHAETHVVGGTDSLAVTALAGYPGGTANFLRADGTFAPPPAPVQTGPTTLKKTANQIINGGAGVFVDVADLTFPVVNGQTYAFYFYVVFRSAQTNTGHRCSVNCPAGTLDFHVLNQIIANSPAGAATWTERHNTARDDMTLLTSTIAAAADLIYIVQGRYISTADGAFALRFANELASNTDVVVQAGSWGFYF